MTLRRIAIVLAVATALAAMALGTHLLMTSAHAPRWALALLLAPALVAATMALAARPGIPRALAWLPAAFGALLLAGRWQPDLPHLFLLQHAGTHALLGAVFAWTLRPGGTPLISRLAFQHHGFLTPAMAVYTRNVTRGWVAYFAGMTLLSLVLFAWAPWPVWSAFANLLTPVAAVALFVLEHPWRRWRHPQLPQTSLRASWSAWQNRDQRAQRPS